MRIFFTGGSGKAGKHVIPYLLDKGHKVLNADLVPLHYPGVANLTADITDSGQMFNAMTSYCGFDEMEKGKGVPAFDAVVHFAAVPRVLLRPDNETFRVNTIGTYNVIEAAVKLGIKKIIIASSETTYGICFSDGQTSGRAPGRTESASGGHHSGRHPADCAGLPSSRLRVGAPAAQYHALRFRGQ